MFDSPRVFNPRLGSGNFLGRTLSNQRAEHPPQADHFIGTNPNPKAKDQLIGLRLPGTSLFERSVVESCFLFFGVEIVTPGSQRRPGITRESNS
jgi:hypothetical protein